MLQAIKTVCGFSEPIVKMKSFVIPQSSKDVFSASESSLSLCMKASVFIYKPCRKFRKHRPFVFLSNNSHYSVFFSFLQLQVWSKNDT